MNLLAVWPTWERMYVTIGPLSFACDPEALDRQLAGHLAMARSVGNMAEPEIDRKTIRAFQQKILRDKTPIVRIMVAGTRYSVPQSVLLAIRNLREGGGSRQWLEFTGHQGQALTKDQAQAVMCRARKWLRAHGVPIGHAVDGVYSLPADFEERWQELVEE